MDNWEVGAILGEGGFGTVWKCRDKTNGGHFAIKKFAELNGRRLERAIAREYTLIAGLKHDNVADLGCAREVTDLDCTLTVTDMGCAREVTDLGCAREVTDLDCTLTVTDIDCIPEVHPKRFGHRRQGLTAPIGTLRYMSPEVVTEDPYYTNYIYEIVSKVGPLTPQQQQRLLTLCPDFKFPEDVVPSTNLCRKYKLRDPQLAELVEDLEKMVQADKDGVQLMKEEKKSVLLPQ
ncbi:hypothetical protein CRUP_005585 [Coryphaenoides rupestris]|nr:hypothetical protein CRUP_005585 [Coryphaenoides rupestris]